MGTHYERKLQQKVLLQLKYIEDKHFVSDFGVGPLSYLWVCPGNPDRVKQLIKLAEATMTEHNLTRHAENFSFTAADPATIDPVHLFTRPNWFVPFQTDPVTLLASPSPSATIRLDHSHYMGQDAYDRFLRTTGEDILQIAPEMDVT